MSSWDTYKLGINFLLHNKKMLWMLLLVNLCFALFIALPINNYVDMSIGDSMSMKAFNTEFNYMLISDFLDNYGMGIDAILSQSTYSLLLLFIISIFISGGILWCVYKNRYGGVHFINGGATYFWKLLRLSIVFIILYLIAIVVVFTIFKNINAGLSPFAMESDARLVNSFWICLVFFAAIASLISVIHNIAKIEMIHSERKWVFQSFTTAFSILKKYFLSFIGIFAINFLLTLFAGFIYFILREIIPCEGGIGLIILMVVAQIYMLTRIALNVINISSFYFMYKNKLDGVNA